MNGAEYRDKDGNILENIAIDKEKVKVIMEVMGEEDLCIELFTNVGTLTSDYEKVKARGAGLYAIDANKPKRKSHQNEDIKKLYAEFLGERGGHNAHTYVHTHYFDRSNPYAKKAEAECTAE